MAIDVVLPRLNSYKIFNIKLSFCRHNRFPLAVNVSTLLTVQR